MKYYNGCLFHTVQKDFTAQTGDPTGTGTGGDSVYKYDSFCVFVVVLYVLEVSKY